MTRAAAHIALYAACAWLAVRTIEAAAYAAAIYGG